MRDDTRYYVYSALCALAAAVAIAGIYCENILFIIVAGMIMTACVFDELRRLLP